MLRVAFISLAVDVGGTIYSRAAFIRGRHLIEYIRYTIHTCFIYIFSIRQQYIICENQVPKLLLSLAKHVPHPSG